MEKTAKSLINTLQNAGYIAYLAGGCVRDEILKKNPKDYDIATNANPDQIEDIFENTYPVGKAFGVITVVENNHTFEIASFRTDDDSHDGRRPSGIKFANSEDDAKRRDFTINALFYDPVKNEYHDHVGALNDINSKIVRFIGDPASRIKEDHLRILRAIRFKNILNFQYHHDTYIALKKYAELSCKISAERMQDEVNKILISSVSHKAFLDMHATQISDYVFPELSAEAVNQTIHELEAFEANKSANQAFTNDEILSCKWHIIAFNSSDPDSMMMRFRLPRKYLEKCRFIQSIFMQLSNLKNLNQGKLRKLFFNENFNLFLAIYHAKNDKKLQNENELKIMHFLHQEYEKCMNVFTQKPSPLLNGHDLMHALSINSGKNIGKILDLIFESQLEEKINTKAQAIEMAKAYIAIQ